jgi:PAS domain S-box-containing protein
MLDQSDRFTIGTSDERFRVLVNAVSDYAIFMLDPGGHVASWNAGAERFKGYASDEIIGRHFSQFYTPEDREAGIPAIALHTARTTGKFEAEGWRVRKGGTRFWAHVVIDPIRDEAGNLTGFAKVTRDLTERREAQQRLEEAREALFQAQKMDALGKLTGGVAHDFNNLLTAVLGSLELVQRRVADDPRTASLVSNAIQAAKRGANLTQRMLAFARRQELKPEVLSIPAIVANLVELLDRSLGDSITVVTRMGAAIGRVCIDPTQLDMAILNLATNARDAMPDGGPLTIDAREEVLAEGNRVGLPAGPYVALSVIDEGEGMDAATLARATEPFFTTKAIGKGTGLGLPMVHGLAEQSGGRLLLRSQPGAGTTATLYLPVYQGPVEPGETCRSPVDSGRPANKPLSILAVDDDALVLMNTAAMLEDKGHEVTLAYSGEAALERLKSGKRFDLLITDHGMPRMTGAQLVELAQALDPSLPVILATGYAELPPGVASSIPRLSKPFLQDELLRAVAGVLRKPSSGAN